MPRLAVMGAGSLPLCFCRCMGCFSRCMGCFCRCMGCYCHGCWVPAPLLLPPGPLCIQPSSQRMPTSCGTDCAGHAQAAHNTQLLSSASPTFVAGNDAIKAAAYPASHSMRNQSDYCTTHLQAMRRVPSCSGLDALAADERCSSWRLLCCDGGAASIGEIGRPQQAACRHIQHLLCNRHCVEVEAGGRDPELPACMRTMGIAWSKKVEDWRARGVWCIQWQCEHTTA